MLSFSKESMPTEDTALAGRDEAMPVKKTVTLIMNHGYPLAFLSLVL